VRTVLFGVIGLVSACALMVDGQWVAAVAVMAVVFGGIGLGAVIIRQSSSELDRRGA